MALKLARAKSSKSRITSSPAESEVMAMAAPASTGDQKTPKAQGNEGVQKETRENNESVIDQVNNEKVEDLKQAPEGIEKGRENAEEPKCITSDSSRAKGAEGGGLGRRKMSNAKTETTETTESGED
eukprot:1365711-Amorphochlora_amoeboformis.AAC.1